MQDLFVQKSFFTAPTIGLFMAGYNTEGELGLNDTNNRSSPVQVGSLSTWNQVATCEKNTFGIKTDGTLWGWGANQYWSLGIGSGSAQSSPVKVGTLTNWKQVSTGNHNASAVKMDGTLWGWGDSYNGNVGFDIPYDGQVSSPQQVGALTNWASVSCSYQTTFAIKTDGTLWGWGNNQGYQLGVLTPQYLPVSSMTQLGTLTTWSIVDAATTVQAHPSSAKATLGIKQDGTAWGMGRNAGNMFSIPGISSNNVSSPVQIGTFTNWKQIVASSASFLGLRADGTLWACGYNRGQLGLGTFNDVSSITQIGSLTTWASISGQQGYSAAIKTDGTLWTWGYNIGNLGIGTTNNTSSPQQVGSLTNWKTVSCGYNSTIATKTDGTLWTMGLNNHGQLGLGDTVDRSSPVQVGTMTNWATASIVNQTTFVIKTDGTLWTCGYNYGGQCMLGIGDTTVLALSSPHQVGSATTWKEISGGNQHVIGLQTNGTLWGWGANYWSNIIPYSDPSAVSGYSAPIQIGTLTSWNQVAACAYSTVANQVAGAVSTRWGWGMNVHGELGTPTTIEYANHSVSSPVQVGLLTNWAQVSSATRCTLAIQTNGTLWAWGDNYSGTLGLGLDVSIRVSSPQQVGSLSNWKQVSASQHLVAAVKTDGTLWTWGDNTAGQNGLNNLIPTSSPVQVGALTNWKQVSTSDTSFVALKTDGSLWACGYNGAGGLGRGNIISYSSPVQVGALTTWTQVAAGLKLMAAIQNNG